MSGFDPAYDFLCRLITANPGTSSAEWEGVIRIASTEKLLPALYGRVLELGIADTVPLEAFEFLKCVRELSFERNSRILSELAGVAQLLNRMGLQPVLLKGAAYLVSGVYSDIASRFLFDLDILIPREAIPSAAEILEKENYVSDSSKESSIHHYRPLHQAEGVEVELHHGLGGKLCDAVLSEREIFSASTLIDFRGARVRLPAPEHLIVHNVLHSQIHHRYSDHIWPLLRDLYDLLLLQKHFGPAIDWYAVKSRFRQNRLNSALALYLRLWENVFEIQHPARIQVTGIARLRWMHRLLLRRYPDLRFVDPIYVFFLSLLPRARHGLKLLRSTDHGWKYLARLPFQTSFYTNFYRSLVDEMKDT